MRKRHWRNKNTYGNGNCQAYGSCEKFKGANVTPGTDASSAFWSRLEAEGKISLDSLDIRLHGAYTDGHVESFPASETVPMKVSFTPDGMVPYPDWLSTNPGTFYLPKNALHYKRLRL